MKTLREVLLALRRGDRLPLERTRNQYGGRFISRSLEFKKGQWVEWEVTCYSSSAFGLGCCHCNSHSPDEEFVISRSEALGLIRDYIRAHNQKEQDKIDEIAWLDDLILKLETSAA